MQARDKIPYDALDIFQTVKMTTDAIALFGATNFELNMRRPEQIKPELNNDNKNFMFKLSAIHWFLVSQRLRPFETAPSPRWHNLSEKETSPRF